MSFRLRLVGLPRAMPAPRPFALLKFGVLGRRRLQLRQRRHRLAPQDLRVKISGLCLAGRMSRPLRQLRDALRAAQGLNGYVSYVPPASSLGHFVH